MILQSKINDSRWYWIKVPRTGTHSYKKFFFGDDGPHLHIEYKNLLLSGEVLPGVSVVRNPRSRFISSLKYIIKSICFNPTCNNHYGLKLPSESVDDLHNFFFTHFDKDCVIKSDNTVETLFNVASPAFVGTFFTLQTSYVYHPKVKIFHYEKLHEFNSWIETELGYDTSKLEHINSTDDSILSHIDFSHPKITEIAQHLYYTDYKLLGYEMTG